MLKMRIITACILLPIILFVILHGSTVLVSSVSAIIFMLAAWEWTKLAGIKKSWLRLAYLCILSSLGIVYKLFNLPLLPICLLALLWWGLSFIAIVMYPRGANFWCKSWVGSFIGGILFLPTWLSIDWLHGAPNFGPIWLVFLCFLVWGADVGAYFIGKKWGKKKLLPNVSAGKTRLGVLGAFLLVLAVVIMFASFWIQQKFIILCMLGFIVVVSSIIGDLTESLFKRIRGCKDSGTLLPGHGGVLDRIDGLLAAVPVFIVGVKYAFS